MKVMKYKNYYGSINSDHGILWGKILLLDSDVVTYEADKNDYDGLRKEFKLAIEDYLSTCKEIGKEPEVTQIMEVL